MEWMDRPTQTFRSRLSKLAAASVSLLVVFLPVQQSDAETQVIATRLDQAPGLDFGVRINSVTAPILNDSGRVLFNLPVSGPGVDVSNGRVLYTGLPGALTPFIRKGDPVPGAPEGAIFGSVFDFALNEANQVTMYASSVGPFFGDSFFGFFTGQLGSISLVVRPGDQAPGTPAGVSFERIAPASCCSSETFWFNEQSEIIFFGVLEGGSVQGNNDQGIWSGQPGSLELVVREDDLIPGSATQRFSHLTQFPDFNNQGEAVFYALINGLGRSIYSGKAGSLSKIAQSGDPAPGLPAGTLFSSFHNKPLINDVGQVAIQGNSFGIWLHSEGSLSLIVHDGEAAAGTPAGVVFSNVAPPRYLNNDGDIAFSGSLSGSGVDTNNNNGIWLGSVDSVSLVVREGDVMPDTANGETFAAPSLSGLNHGGQVAFLNKTSTFGAESLWLGDGIELIRVVREGDVVGGKPVFDINIRRGLDSSTSSLNNLGQITYSATFTNDLIGADDIAVLYTPELHWRGTAGDDRWDSPTNWTLSIDPAHVHDVFIDPDTDLTVAGPSSDTTVESLAIGGIGIATLQWNAGSKLTVIDSVEVASQGRLNLAGGSALHVGDTAGVASTPDSILIGPGGVLTVMDTGGITVGTSAGAAGDGELRIASGARVELAGGTLDMHGNDITPIDAAAFVFTDGLLKDVDTFTSSLDQKGGILAPGDPIGITSIQGDYQMSASSTLLIDFANDGQTAGIDFDAVSATGTVTLNGLLNVSQLSPIALSLGDSFRIVTGGAGVAGNFSQIVLFDTPHIGMRVSYEPDAVVLTTGVVGDLNSDGFVGLEDLNTLLSHWNLAVPAGDWAQGDPSGDGLVGLDDLNMILNQWNAGTTGDLDFDGFVGIEDLNIVLGAWNNSVDAGVWGLGDPTGDGFVGIDDLNVVLGNWNAGTPPPPQASTNIPEPGTFLLLGLTGFALVRRNAQ